MRWFFIWRIQVINATHSILAKKSYLLQRKTKKQQIYFNPVYQGAVIVF
jgi:hypothetical protein